MNKQHALIRLNRIGSSDAPKILGCRDANGTGHDVYLRLTHRLDEYDRDNPWMELGRMLERPLLLKAAKELGLKIRCNVLRVKGNLSAQLDAIAVWHDTSVESVDGVEIIEAKRSKNIGLEAKSTEKIDDWGDDGSSDVPEAKAAQALHQAAVADLDLVVFPVYFTGYQKGYRKYFLTFTPEQRAQYIEFMENWFATHITGDTPPDCAPSLEVAKLIKRVPGKTVVASQAQIELVAKWKEAKATATSAKKLADAAQADILASMNDAEVLDVGEKVVEWRTVTRKAYMVEESSYKTLKEVKK